MIEWIVILLTGFFQVSRFFSEVLLVLPKWVDILDLPFVALLTGVALFHKRNAQADVRQDRFILQVIGVFLFFTLFSALINSATLLVPAALLFIIGFLAGPLQFLSLNRMVTEPDRMSRRIKSLFLFLLVANMAVVLFVDLPLFRLSRNPDDMSGTYGLNAYQFSMLLIICGGLLLGESYRSKKWRIPLLIGQAVVFMTFYLLQFRAALPFFIVAYGVALVVLFGWRTIWVSLAALPVVVVLSATLYISVVRTQGFEQLRFEDWLVILLSPEDIVQAGKFTAYPQTLEMMADIPIVMVAGVGPGNFMSRAYYTFSTEMIGLSKGKTGVSGLIADVFGLTKPRYTEVSEHYLEPTRTGAILGTHLLAQASSSYLAPAAEIGLIGGSMIFLLYIHLVRRSVKLLKVAKRENSEFLPLACGLTVGSVYFFGLGFVDNYWEVTRMSMLLWLSFWGTQAGITSKFQSRTGISQSTILSQ